MDRRLNHARAVCRLLFILGAVAFGRGVAESSTAAPGGDDFCESKKCGACLTEEGCKWCTGYSSMKLPNREVPMQPWRFPGICTKKPCDHISFGTLKNIVDQLSVQVAGLTMDYKVQAANLADCDKIEMTSADSAFPPTATIYHDCETCVKASANGDAAGWCEYDATHDALTDNFKANGGACAPCVKEDFGTIQGAEVGKQFLSLAKDIHKCKLLGSAVAPKSIHLGFRILAALALLPLVLTFSSTA